VPFIVEIYTLSLRLCSHGAKTTVFDPWLSDTPDDRPSCSSVA
jgi:hypothetical protein